MKTREIDDMIDRIAELLGSGRKVQYRQHVACRWGSVGYLYVSLDLETWDYTLGPMLTARAAAVYFASPLTPDQLRAAIEAAEVTT